MNSGICVLTYFNAHCLCNINRQQKDFRVNVSGKTSVEQAVQDHFEESLRLAQYKGAPHQSLVVKHDERLNPIPNAPMQRFYPPPHDKRHHGNLK